MRLAAVLLLLLASSSSSADVKCFSNANEFVGQKSCGECAAHNGIMGCIDEFPALSGSCNACAEVNPTSSCCCKTDYCNRVAKPGLQCAKTGENSVSIPEICASGDFCAVIKDASTDVTVAKGCSSRLKVSCTAAQRGVKIACCDSNICNGNPKFLKRSDIWIGEVDSDSRKTTTDGDLSDANVTEAKNSATGSDEQSSPGTSHSTTPGGSLRASGFASGEEEETTSASSGSGSTEIGNTVEPRTAESGEPTGSPTTTTSSSRATDSAPDALKSTTKRPKTTTTSEDRIPTKGDQRHTAPTDAPVPDSSNQHRLLLALPLCPLLFVLYRE